MSILTRYLLKEFIKLFMFFIIGFIAIYVVIDVIENANRFAEAGLNAATMASYMLLQIPEIVTLLTPVAVLMSTIITLGIMGNRNELVAMKSAGISLMRFTLPVLLSALCISIALLMLSEAVLPYTKAQTNYIKNVLVRKQEPTTYYKQKFWHKGQNSIYEIGSYDLENKVLHNITYYHFDNEFNMDLRIDANKAQFVMDPVNGARWRFYEGLYQERMASGGYNAAPFLAKDLIMPENPDDFTKLAKPTSEMNVGELAGFIEKIESEGYDATRYIVDMHSKVSMALACLMTALFGVPLALFRGNSKENHIARAVVLGAAVAFFYWVGSGYIIKIFGYYGMLPSALAAWMPNILFTLAALWMYTHIKQ